MNEKLVRETLYNKMNTEYEKFITNLLQEEPQEIINKADEISAKKEMLVIFEPELSYYKLDKILLLNELDNPLEELYIAHVACNDEHKSLVENNVELFLDDLEYEKNPDVSRSFMEQEYHKMQKEQIEFYKKHLIQDNDIQM